MPELHVLAGPNGSGKSTFTRQVLEGQRSIDYRIPSVINPDVIAKELNPDDPDAAALAAGREAISRRERALHRGENFAIETTLSGHGELELLARAKSAGYSVTMTFVAVESAEMSAARVIARAREEGRTVPVEVVYRRYSRSLANLTASVARVDRIDVYDNSDRELAFVARFVRSRVSAMASTIPEWAEKALREPLMRERDRLELVRATSADFQRVGQIDAPVAERDIQFDNIEGVLLRRGPWHATISTGRVTFVVVESAQLAQSAAPGDHVRVTRRHLDDLAREYTVRGRGQSFYRRR
jgi:predicted ABC-type ATPase